MLSTCLVAQQDLQIKKKQQPTNTPTPPPPQASPKKTQSKSPDDCITNMITQLPAVVLGYSALIPCGYTQDLPDFDLSSKNLIEG